MAAQEVPPSTKCNPNRLHNLPTERLQARLDWLTGPAEQKADRDSPTSNLGVRARNTDGHSGSGRGGLADAAREVLRLQQVLAERADSGDEDISAWSSELRPLLDTLDVPDFRKDPMDVAWLGRNLHINNLDKADFPRASRLVRKLQSAGVRTI